MKKIQGRRMLKNLPGKEEDRRRSKRTLKMIFRKLKEPGELLEGGRQLLEIRKYKISDTSIINNFS